MRTYLVALLAVVALCAACSSRPAPNRTFTSSILPPPTASISTSLTSPLPTPGSGSIISPLRTPVSPLPSSTRTSLTAPPTTESYTQNVKSATPSATAAFYTTPPFYIYDLSFVDTKHGWAVGALYSVSANASEPAMRRTSDGGRTWESSPPPPITGRLQFANLHDGWVYGPGIATTQDGGQTWAKDDMDGDILALQSTEKDVWAVVRRCSPPVTPPSGQNCAYSLRQWLTGTSPRSAATVPLPQVNGTLVRQGQDRGWMLSPAGWPPVEGGQTTYTTADGGLTWTAIGPIPTRMDCIALATDTAGTLWALCIGGVATIEQERSLLQSRDGGQHWTEVAAGRFPVNPGLKNMGDQGHPFDLVVVSPQTVFVFQTRTPPLLATYDGGRTWATAPSMPALDEARNLVRMTFVGSLYGWAATPDGLLYLTQDGGRTWTSSNISETSAATSNPSSMPIAPISPLSTPAMPTPTISPLVNVGSDVAEALARSPSYLELTQRGDAPFKVAPSPVQAGAKLPELAVFYIDVLKDKGGTPAPLSSLVAVAFYRAKNGIYERVWEHPADVENPQIGHPTDSWPWVRPYFEAFDINGDGRTEVMAAGCGNGNKCYYRASVWSDDGRLLFRLEPDNFTGMQFFSSEHTIVTRTGLNLANQFPFNPQQWRLNFYNWNGSEYARKSSRIVPYGNGADPLKVEGSVSGTVLVDSAVYASAPGKWDGWSLWSVDVNIGTTDEFRWAKALGSLWLLGWSRDEGLLIQAWPDNRNEHYYRVAPDGTYREAPAPALGPRPWHPSDPRLLSFDGKNVRLRDASGEHYEQADISPDGKQVVFAWCDSTTMMCGIYRTDIDGSGLTTLVPAEMLEGDKPSRFKIWPRWSPNGTRIAFMAGQSAAMDLSLWVMSADGGQRRRLAETTGEGLGGGFAWSPDSRKLAFLSDSNGIDYMQTGSGKGMSRIFPARSHYVYVIDVDGRNVSRLADMPLVYTSSLLWLPEEAGW